ncbi:MAG: deoxyribodipyrimidine photo-lyase [Candidatus Babeliales bacterium]
MKPYQKSLFIFRRDLRLFDNTALIKALEESALVIPCFIFDPRQVTDANAFKSTNALEFMIESLKDLHDQLTKHGGKLYLFYGDPAELIKKLITQEEIDAVYVNKDYTPFSIGRDDSIKKVCTHYDVAFDSCKDALLTEPYEVLTLGNVPYSVFTPFFKTASKITVAHPKTFPKISSFYKKPIKFAQSSTIFKKIVPQKNQNLWVQGGTSNGKKILRNLKKFKNYAKERDYPALDATTHLSAHNKFGTISIRQVYHAIADQLGKNHPLITQLYWRDFFTHVGYHSPFVFGAPFKQKYEKLTWNTNKTIFERWCTGTTGFPIVDAGMRQLNATGFMHNRVRMIVGSFLVKDLFINWLWGEKYFAQQLVDYDPAVNNGNWQWVASTGCDSQPYFRIFNPWLQQKKFDADCIYIKQWIPELNKISSQAIHRWYSKHQEYDTEYPKPMVDHAAQSTMVKAFYKKL